MRQIIAIATALVLWAGCDSAGSSQEPAGVDTTVMVDDAGSTDAWIQGDSATPPKADSAYDDVTNQADTSSRDDVSADAGGDVSPQDTTPPVDYTGKWCPEFECYLEPGTQGGWDCPPNANSMTPQGVARICGFVE